MFLLPMTLGPVSATTQDDLTAPNNPRDCASRPIPGQETRQ